MWPVTKFLVFGSKIAAVCFKVSQFHVVCCSQCESVEGKKVVMLTQRKAFLVIFTRKKTTVANVVFDITTEWRYQKCIFGSEGTKSPNFRNQSWANSNNKNPHAGLFVVTVSHCALL